jgi:hypothetical protein
MYTASATNSKLLYTTQSPNPSNTVLHRSHDEIVSTLAFWTAHFCVHTCLLVKNKISFFIKWLWGSTKNKLRVKVVHWGNKVEKHCVKRCLDKRQVWISIFHIINFKKKIIMDFFNKKLILDYYFCLKSGPVFLFQIFIIAPLPLPGDIKSYVMGVHQK